MFAWYVNEATACQSDPFDRTRDWRDTFNLTTKLLEQNATGWSRYIGWGQITDFRELHWICGPNKNCGTKRIVASTVKLLP
jgi:hypothetical protein